MRLAVFSIILIIDALLLATWVYLLRRVLSEFYGKERQKKEDPPVEIIPEVLEGYRALKADKKE